MALQSNEDLNGLPISSVFNLSFQFLILYLLVPVCTQFHHLFFGRYFLHQQEIWENYKIWSFVIITRLYIYIYQQNDQIKDGRMGKTVARIG